MLRSAAVESAGDAGADPHADVDDPMNAVAVEGGMGDEPLRPIEHPPPPPL